MQITETSSTSAILLAIAKVLESIKEKVSSASGGGSSDVEWGDILGNLTDQIDLINFVAVKRPDFSDENSSTPTVEASWEQKIINFTSNSAVSLELPSDATLNIPVGFTFTGRRGGDGNITISAGSGASLQAADNKTETENLYAGFVAVKISSNTWWVFGDLTN